MMKADIHLSPEQELLLALCCYPATESDKKRITDKQKLVTDWYNFGDLARAHGIEAIAWHNLTETGLQEILPERIRYQFEEASIKSLARNTFIASIADDAVSCLVRNGIEPVMLKGMALEGALYGGKGLRQMSDADMLVPRDMALTAREILKNNGFTSLPVKSWFHKKILIHIGKHLPSMVKGGILVEIHHRLFSDDKNELTAQFYNESRTRAISGEILIPPPAHLFVYLVDHLLKHEQNNESQLRLYLDLKLLAQILIKEGEIEHTLAIAEEAGIAEAVKNKIGILNDFLNPQITIPVEPDPLSYSDARAAFTSFLGSPKDNPITHREESYRSALASIPGFHRKMLYILGDLFPTIAFMKKRYKRKSTLGAMLFYPHRLGKLFWI